MKEIECVVSGRVQGVTYRSFAHKKASALWLSGYVENLPDHRVRLVAQGQEDKLEALIELLWKGPFGAHIQDVSVAWRESIETYHGFSIRY